MADLKNQFEFNLENQKITDRQIDCLIKLFKKVDQDQILKHSSIAWISNNPRTHYVYIAFDEGYDLIINDAEAFCEDPEILYLATDPYDGKEYFCESLEEIQKINSSF